MEALERRAGDGVEKDSSTNDPGSLYDFVQFVNQTVGKHFKCCICLSIFNDPVMLPCNHALCRECATQALRQNQRCPQCMVAIPNLRMLQGRNAWISEMVDSLRNCLNEVGASLTQHAPVPPMYANARPPKPRPRARRRSSSSGSGSGDRFAPPSPPYSVSCGGGSTATPVRESNNTGNSSSTRRRRRRSPVHSSSSSAADPPVTPPRRATARSPSSRSGRVEIEDIAERPAGIVASRSERRTPSSRQQARGAANVWGHQATEPDEESGRQPDTAAAATTAAGVAATEVPPLSPIVSPPPPARPFVIGDLVFVDHRTWPGVNKHGGVGLVVSVLDPPGSSYDVRYSVGGSLDRGVEARYVHPHYFTSDPVGVRSRRRSNGGSGTVGGRGGAVPNSARRKRSGSAAPSSDVVAVASPALAAANISTSAAVSASTSRPPASQGMVTSRNRASTLAVSMEQEDEKDEEKEKQEGQGAEEEKEEQEGETKGEEEKKEKQEGEEKEDEGEEKEDQKEEGEEFAPSDVSDDVSREKTTNRNAGCDVLPQRRRQAKQRKGQRRGGVTSGRGDNPAAASVSAAGGGGGGSGLNGNHDSEERIPEIGEEWDSGGIGAQDYGKDDNGTADVISRQKKQDGGRVQRERQDEEQDTSKIDTQRPEDEETALLVDAEQKLPVNGTVTRVFEFCDEKVGQGEEEAGQTLFAMETRETVTGGTPPIIIGAEFERRSPLPPPALPFARLGLHEDEPTADAEWSDRDSCEMVTARESTVDPGTTTPGSAKVNQKTPRTPGSSTAVAPSLSHSSLNNGCPQLEAQVGSSRAESGGAIGNLLGSGNVANMVFDRPQSPKIGCNTSSPSLLEKNADNHTINLSADSETSPPSAVPRRRRPVPTLPPGNHTTNPPARAVLPPLEATPKASSSASRTIGTPATGVLSPATPIVNTPRLPAYKVGDVVDVRSQTSPGLNKEGGVGRVTRVDPTGLRYDVKYLLRGGTDKGVSAALLSKYDVDGESVDRNGSVAGPAAAGGGSGGGKRRRDGSTVASARAGVEGGNSSAKKRTHRATRGISSADTAAGLANAACLNALLGDTQHPELLLEYDSGEDLDPTKEGNPAAKEKKRENEAAKIPPIKREARKHGVVDSVEMTGSSRARRSRGKSPDHGGGSKGRSVSSGGGSVTTESAVRREKGEGKGKAAAAAGAGGGIESNVRRSSMRRKRKHYAEVSSSEEHDAHDEHDSEGGEGDGSEPDVVAAGRARPNRSGRTTAIITSREKKGTPAAVARHQPPPPSPSPTGASERSRAGKRARSGKSSGSAPTAAKLESSRGGRGGSKGITRVSGVCGIGRVGGRSAGSQGRGGAVVITLSGLKPDMTKLADKVAKSRGWTVEPKYTEGTTHVVCGAEQGTKTVKIRSVKYLRAVAAGKWIVSDVWLKECQRQSSHVSEEDFEITGDKKSEVPSAPRRSRLSHANLGRRGLFENTIFHFRGDFGTESPPRSELVPMLIVNGGIVEDTLASLFDTANERNLARDDDDSDHAGNDRRKRSPQQQRPRLRRVVLFQASASSPERDAVALSRELRALAEKSAGMHGLPGACGKTGGAGLGVCVEVVRPLWLVDSIGAFRALTPSDLHRVALPETSD